jgi:glucan phosphoethanolaminetransferase (alkaline phosphatase superfamily)
MKLLNLLVLLMSVIGITLVITTFYIYSNIPENCDIKSIRSQLQLIIAAGVTLSTISIGYFICIIGNTCDCDFGERTDWKMIGIMAILLSLGVAILIINSSVQAKLQECNVKLPYSNTIMIVLSILQIVLAFSVATYSIVRNDTQKTYIKPIKIKQEPGSEIKVKQEPGIPNYKESVNNKKVIDERRRQRFQDIISGKEEELSILQDRIESDGRGTPEDVVGKRNIEADIEKYKKQLSSI